LGGGDEEKRRERLLEKGYDPDKYLGGRARNTILKHYNEVDAVITSPPYESAVSNNKEGPLAGGDEERFGRWKKGTAKKQSYTQHEEPCKIDAVITSPPYGPAETRDRNPVQSGYPEDMMKRSYTQSKHMSEKNLCKLELGKIDAVITSPPYDSALEGTTRHTRGGIVSRDKKCASSGFFTGYSPNKQNIGNLKSSEEEYEALRKGLMKGKKPTYLSEMLCVYREIWKVLKPGGLAIIVVRPFIRRKKVIDLPYYTYLLMSKVGFKLVELLKLYLYRGSFWRVLYHKKYPEVPRIAYEYVLVCKKEV
jgi:DNA modification methylase